MIRHIKINLNDTFLFKLTPDGIAFEEAEAKKQHHLNYQRYPDPNNGGYLMDQLWQIAQDFGRVLYLGSTKLPIETGLVALVEVPEIDEEIQSLHDQIDTYFAQGTTLREALGVSVEPHQSLFERILTQVETDARDAARYRLIRTSPYWAEENRLQEGEELDSALDFLLAIGVGLEDFNNSAWRHWYLKKHGTSMRFEGDSK